MRDTPPSGGSGEESDLSPSQTIELAPGIGVMREKSGPADSTADTSVTRVEGHANKTEAARPTDETGRRVNSDQRNASPKSSSLTTAPDTVPSQSEIDFDWEAEELPIELGDDDIMSQVEMVMYNTRLGEAAARVYMETNVKLAALRWPTRPGLSHADRVYLFAGMWNQVLRREPELGFVNDPERVRLWRAANRARA